MKKIFAFIFLAAFVTMSSAAAPESNNKNVIGKWNYEVSTAPAGYEKGTLIITEKENELAGEVKFSNGQTVKLQDLEFKNNTLTFGLYVDYEYISSKVSIEGEKMKGTVDSPEGKITITAERAKQAKQQ